MRAVSGLLADTATMTDCRHCQCTVGEPASLPVRVPSAAHDPRPGVQFALTRPLHVYRSSSAHWPSSPRQWWGQPVTSSREGAPATTAEESSRSSRHSCVPQWHCSCEAAHEGREEARQKGRDGYGAGTAEVGREGAFAPRNSAGAPPAHRQRQSSRQATGPPAPRDERIANRGCGVCGCFPGPYDSKPLPQLISPRLHAPRDEKRRAWFSSLPSLHAPKTEKRRA